MAAYKFWWMRVSKFSNPTTIFFNMSEFALLNAADTSVMPTPYTVNKASPASSTSYVSSLFDGSSSPWYHTGVAPGTPASLLITLGTPVEAAKLRTQVYDYGYYPSDFELFASNDLSTWDQLLAVTNDPATVDYEFKTYNLASSPISQLITPPTPVWDNYVPAFAPRSPDLNSVAQRISSVSGWSSETKRIVISQKGDGGYYIAGNTTELGIPSAKRVWLLDQESAALVAWTDTDKTGIFRFDGLENRPYSVIGVDTLGARNSVIYAHVSPVPLE